MGGCRRAPSEGACSGGWLSPTRGLESVETGGVSAAPWVLLTSDGACGACLAHWQTETPVWKLQLTFSLLPRAGV